MNKARDLASALHYYSGAAGAKKKPLPQTSPRITTPFPSTPHRADIATQQAGSPLKEPTNLEELLEMNGQHIKIDIQHKPLAGSQT